MRLLRFKDAVGLIKAGKVVIYPTSTLYGVGCDAFNTTAVSRISDIKNNRDSGFICLVSGMEMAMEIAEFNDLALCLAEKFWPGPLTMVLRAKKLPDAVTAGNGTVALRNDPMALDLVRAAGVPVISTSANLPGMPPPKETERIDPALVALVDGVLPANGPLGGKPSTIVDATGDKLRVLRIGAIPEQDVPDACGEAFS